MNKYILAIFKKIIKFVCNLKRAQCEFKTYEELSAMDKLELEAYGRTIGIELDRRRNIDTLISQVINRQEYLRYKQKCLK